SNNGRHRPSVLGARFFHQPSALSYQPQDISEEERTRCHKSGVLSQAVPGYERGSLMEGTGVQSGGKNRKRSGQHGGLGVDSSSEFLFGAFEAKAAKLGPQHLVCWLKHGLRARGRLRRLEPHAELLCALAWK